MNRRGFTLVELLVAVALLGILSGISLPLISRFRDDNKLKKYEIYRESVSKAGRLYIDAYAEDEFGYNAYGCTTVPYGELVSKKLLKDIQIDKESCNSENTFAYVLKDHNKYYYVASIGCGKKKANGTSDDSIIVKPGKDIYKCSATGKGSMYFSYDLEKYENAHDKKSVEERVFINSNAGLKSTSGVTYGWYLGNSLVKSGTLSYSQIPLLSRQMDLLKAGKIPITVASGIITSPTTVTGKLDLKITGGTIYNAFSQSYSVSELSDTSTGQYWVDNTAPEFVSGLTVKSSEPDHNSLTPIINIGTIRDRDVNGVKSLVRELDVCVKYNGTSCSDDDFDNYVDYYTDAEIPDDIDESADFTGTPIDIELGKVFNSYDGSTKNFTIIIRDLAGNTTTRTISYTVPRECTISYNSNGGTACDNDKQFEGRSWGDLCIPTRSGYEFTGWNTKSDGTGTAITGSTVASSSSGTCNFTPYAQWKESNMVTVVVNFKKNGASSIGAASRTCKYDKTKASSCSISAPSISRSGWSVVGWNTSSGGKTSSLNVGASKSFSSNATYYAVTSKKLTASFKYQNGYQHRHNKSATEKDSCTLYNTNTSCTVTTAPLSNLPDKAKSGCGDKYNTLVKVKGWNTSKNATSGTAGGKDISISANKTYYSIFAVTSKYVNKSSEFKVADWTCKVSAGKVSKTNIAELNVYNRTDAKEGSYHSKKTFIAEGEFFKWNGNWKINSHYDDGSDQSDNAYFYLVGVGVKNKNNGTIHGISRTNKYACCTSCCSDCKSSYCYSGSYVKAYHLKW